MREVRIPIMLEYHGEADVAIERTSDDELLRFTLPLECSGTVILPRKWFSVWINEKLPREK